MKKYISLLMSVILAVTLTGCWDNMEYENMALIRTIGFDIDTNREYILTVEFVKPEIKNKIQNQVGEIRTGKGITVAEALNNLQKETRNEVFLGYTAVIIISQEIKNEKLKNILDFLYITPDVRESVYIGSSKGKAADIITKGVTTDMLVGDQIQEYFKSLPRTGNSFSVRLAELVQMIVKSGIEPVLPEIEISKQGHVKVSEMVIYKGFENVGILNEEESRAWGVITGKRVHPLVSIYPILSNEKEPVLLEVKLRESKTKIKVKIENGLPAVNISVKTNVGTHGYSDPNKPMTQDMLNLYQNTLEEHIKRNIETTIKKAQKDLHCDIFGIGLKVYQQHRKEWKGLYEKDWNKIFSQIPINIEVHATIQNSGMVLSPLLEK